eukprot:2625903-Pleurochrysis_carterae.AAC.1
MLGTKAAAFCKPVVSVRLGCAAAGSGKSAHLRIVDAHPQLSLTETTAFIGTSSDGHGRVLRLNLLVSEEPTRLSPVSVRIRSIYDASPSAIPSESVVSDVSTAAHTFRLARAESALYLMQTALATEASRCTAALKAASEKEAEKAAAIEEVRRLRALVSSADERAASALEAADMARGALLATEARIAESSASEHAAVSRANAAERELEQAMARVVATEAAAAAEKLAAEQTAAELRVKLTAESEQSAAAAARAVEAEAAVAAAEH